MFGTCWEDKERQVSDRRCDSQVQGMAAAAPLELCDRAANTFISYKVYKRLSQEQ